MAVAKRKIEKQRKEENGSAGRKLALVTGATGKVGSRLVAELLDEGYAVRGLVRTKQDADKLPKGVEAVVGDITKPETLKGCCKNVDVVFHLAALVSYTASRGVMQSINGRGTANIVKEAHEAGVGRFVYASSIAIYGKVERGKPLHEADVPAPTDDYGATKLAGENAVKYGGVPFVMLRIGMVYGRGFDEGYFALFRMLQRRWLPYVGSGKNNIPFVHVEDVVRALVLAGRKDGIDGNVYNVVGMPVAQEEALQLSCKYLGVPAPKLHASGGFLMLVLKKMNWLLGLFGRKPKFIPAYLEAIAADRRFEIEKAQMELGWEPKREIGEGIAEVVQWYKEKTYKIFLTEDLERARKDVDGMGLDEEKK
ncbi:MAG: NAD-dependent epimerase/dehydratase family protein [Candidatus Micrarchaeia archaeon]|jgi:nucleoside-diphosphate-sugar epimerase